MKEDVLLFPVSNLIISAVFYTVPCLRKEVVMYDCNLVECAQVSAVLREPNSQVFFASVTIFSSPDGHCVAVSLTGMRPSECRE